MVRLHLGNGRSIRPADVVAILDYALFRKENREHLLASQRDGRLDPGDAPEVESVVVTVDNRVYLSSRSRHALARRAAGRPVATSPRGGHGRGSGPGGGAGRSRGPGLAKSLHKRKRDSHKRR